MLWSTLVTFPRISSRSTSFFVCLFSFDVFFSKLMKHSSQSIRHTCAPQELQTGIMSSLVSLPIFYAMSLQKEEKGKNHTTNPETNTMNFKNHRISSLLGFSHFLLSALVCFLNILLSFRLKYVGGCLKKGEQNPLV